MAIPGQTQGEAVPDQTIIWVDHGPSERLVYYCIGHEEVTRVLELARKAGATVVNPEVALHDQIVLSTN